MAKGRDTEWRAAGKADRDQSVAEGTIELPRSIELGKRHGVVAVRCQGQQQPVIELKVAVAGRRAPVLSRVDYERLQPPLAFPEIELRALTRREAAKRTTKRVSLPALATTAAVGTAVAIFVPVVAPVAAVAAVPAAAIALWRAFKGE